MRFIAGQSSRNIFRSLLRFPTFSTQTSRPNAERDILAHWVWALPVILAVAALAISRVDFYPPRYDEFFFMLDSGWILDGPHSTIDVIRTKIQYDPPHTPFYFILLNLWGSLAGTDIVLGRVLSIFCALLALATVYRLARDIVSPVAGLFATVIVASNVFFSYYVLDVTMYSLLVLLATMVLWLYLRIICRPAEPKTGDYLTLFGACLALAYTHAFSALFFLVLGLYHLLLAPKNRIWVLTSLAVMLAILAYSPYMTIQLREFSQGIGRWDAPEVNGWIALSNWLAVMFNGGLPLALICALLILKYSKAPRSLVLFPPLTMLLLFVLVFTAIGQFTSFIALNKLRITLTGLPIVSLAAAAGLATLYDKRKWLGLTALLWVIFAISYQQSGEVGRYLSKGHNESYREPAWHAVSRLSQETGRQTTILGYRVYVADLHSIAYNNLSQYDHYFRQQNIAFGTATNRQSFEQGVRDYSISAPSLWVIYQSRVVKPEEVEDLNIIWEQQDYIFCDDAEVGHDTKILQFKWKILGCDAPDSLASHQTSSIQYDIYAMSNKRQAQQLVFVDRWRPRNNFQPGAYHLSHQLIDEDWNMVAQLDVPLVHAGKLRRFSIDVSDVPPGKYRLVVILYNALTGERESWLGNTGYIPEMLSLGEVVLY